MPEESSSNSNHDQASQPHVVNRQETRESQKKRPNRKLIIGASALAVVLLGSAATGLGLSGCGKKSESAATVQT
ncbi:MAG: hypothetical protein WD029_06700, partial [Microthrixaceae bacterium]